MSSFSLLSNEPSVVPMREDGEPGMYNMLFLDACLMDVETRFEDLNSETKADGWVGDFSDPKVAYGADQVAGSEPCVVD